MSDGLDDGREAESSQRPGTEPAHRGGAHVALGLLLILAGVVWLLATIDAFDVSVQFWIAVLLVIVGVALMVLPNTATGALVAVGIVLAFAGTLSSVLHVDVGGGIGDRRETPVTEADLRGGYDLAVGALELDLTRLEADGQVAAVANVGIGELVVTVPQDAEVVVDAHVGIGEIDAFDNIESGLDVDLRRRFGGGGANPLALELEVGIGEVRVVRDASA